MPLRVLAHQTDGQDWARCWPVAASSSSTPAQRAEAVAWSTTRVARRKCASAPRARAIGRDLPDESGADRFAARGRELIVEVARQAQRVRQHREVLVGDAPALRDDVLEPVVARDGGAHEAPQRPAGGQGVHAAAEVEFVDLLHVVVVRVGQQRVAGEHPEDPSQVHHAHVGFSTSSSISAVPQPPDEGGPKSGHPVSNDA